MLKVKATLINAEGQINTYKTIKGDAEGKEYIKAPPPLVKCKTKGQC